MTDSYWSTQPVMVDSCTAEIGSNGATDDVGYDNAIREGFPLSFFDVGTEAAAGARVAGVGAREAAAKMGENNSGDKAASTKTCKSGAGAVAAAAIGAFGL